MGLPASPPATVKHLTWLRSGRAALRPRVSAGAVLKSNTSKERPSRSSVTWRVGRVSLGVLGQSFNRQPSALSEAAAAAVVLGSASVSFPAVLSSCPRRTLPPPPRPLPTSVVFFAVSASAGLSAACRLRLHVSLRPRVRRRQQDLLQPGLVRQSPEGWDPRTSRSGEGPQKKNPLIHTRFIGGGFVSTSS
jgi:hypothetical protein